MPKVKPPRAVAKTCSGTKTKMHKIQPTAPFLEPSPKYQTSKKAFIAAVTPSPKSKRVNKRQEEATELSSAWLVHDKLLQGVTSNDPFYVSSNFDAKSRKFVVINWRQHCELEFLLRDPMFKYPHLVEVSEEEGNKWKQYVLNLSVYPTERIQAVLDEYKKDMALHDELLKSTREGINDRRYGGNRFYLRALNCIMFDSFTRCHVPFPPLPTWNLEVEVGITRKVLYKKQLSAWCAYRTRVFELLGLVIKYPAKMERYVNLLDVSPLKHRGQMVQMNELCKNEEECIPFYSNPRPQDEGAEERDQTDGDLMDKPACECRGCMKKFKQLVTIRRK